MNQLIGVTLLGGSAISSRIHERLPRNLFRVRAISGPKSPFRRSTFVDEYVALGGSRDSSISEIVDAAEQGGIAPDDWVISGTDALLRALAQSMIPEARKLSLLPTKKPEGLLLLGSKAGLVEIARRHGIRMARTELVSNREDLAHALAGATYPLMLKGDGGASGQQVRFVDSRSAVDVETIPAPWFPVLLQEHIEGPMVSVEALFRKGQLTRYLYSRALQFTHSRGPSTARHFQSPLAVDFIEPLEKLGQVAGLHGFANCSFVWDESRQSHWLFEVDMRPNRWHQFGPDLGVNWAEGMWAAPIAPISGESPHREAVIRLYPREIANALASRNYRDLVPWVTGEPGTWQWRQRLDRAVSRQELRTIARGFLDGFTPRNQINKGRPGRRPE